MDYKNMIDAARSSGVWNEDTMLASVNSINRLLDEVKKSHPEDYWRFMREQYGIMYGDHYGKEFAEYDVAQISYTDRDGKQRTGAHWTLEQIEEATKGMPFPSEVTKWDKFVAINAFFADTCKVLSDEDVIKAAHQFYFADEDWSESKNGSAQKIWQYMMCKNK